MTQKCRIIIDTNLFKIYFTRRHKDTERVNAHFSSLCASVSLCEKKQDQLWSLFRHERSIIFRKIKQV